MDIKKVKIFIVDDHKIFRNGLRIVIEESDRVSEVFEAEHGALFLELMPEINPDIVFMDINMPGIDGYETTQKALKIDPSLSIIAMSANGNINSVNKMLSAGAKAYLLKEADYDEVHNAIENVIYGKNYFSKNVLVKLSTNLQKNIFNKISDRELDVLELVCKGLSAKDISEKLFISVRTVEKHKANLFLKTDTDNTLNLALFAFKNNLVQTDF